MRTAEAPAGGPEGGSPPGSRSGRITSRAPVENPGRRGRAGPVEYPRYVEACATGAWHLALEAREADGVTGELATLRVCFRCLSWRHAGACRARRNAEDFDRVWRALKGEGPTGAVDPQDVVFLLNTGGGGDGLAERYRAIWRLSVAFRQRIERRWGKLRYVATVERHRSGEPHVNNILVCPELAGLLRLREHDDYPPAGRLYRRTVADLKAMAAGVGYGWFVGTPEVARSVQDVAGYVLKLASTNDLPPEVIDGRTVGEVVKMSQVPDVAPPHFRRLRASRGFLPPAPRSERWTGSLVMEPLPAGPPDT